MKLTFFSSVQLNSSYQRVISTNILESYLNTRQKFTIEDEKIYLGLNGDLSIKYVLPDSVSSTYNRMEYYNYMMAEWTVGRIDIKKYYFIDNLRLVNDIMAFTYKEDIYSNYSDSINFIEGYIERSTCDEYNYPYRGKFFIKRTVKRDSISPPTIRVLSNFNNTRRYVIIFGVQFTESKTIFSSDHPTRYNLFGYTTSSELNSIEADINNVVSHQKDGKFEYTTGQTSLICNYQIGNIWIFPAEFFGNFLTNVGNTHYFKSDNSNFLLVKDIFGLINYNNIAKPTVGYNLSVDDINPNGILSYGVLGRQFENNLNNLTKLNIRVIFIYSKTDIKLMLSHQNEMDDITEEFKYIMPFISVTSEQYTSEKINKAIGFVSSTIRTTLDVAGYVSGVKEMTPLDITGLGAKEALAAFNKNINENEKIRNYNRNLFFDKSEATLNDVGGIVRSLSPLTVGKVSNMASIALATAYLGIIGTYIDDDYNYQNDVAENEGNVVRKYIKGDRIPEPFSSVFKVNYIKFSNVFITGAFSDEIALFFQKLFTRGVKIVHNNV